MYTSELPLIIHGCGRLSEILSLWMSSSFSNVYYLVDSAYINPHHIPQSNIISDVSQFSSAHYISSIGYKDMSARRLAFDTLKARENILPVNYFHPHSHIAQTVKIGTGNIVFPGVVIEDGVTIGDNNIIWSNTSICHDSVVKDHCFIAASSVIGGYSILENSCFIGFGTIINENLRLSSKIRTASGTVVIDSQLETGISICGVPSRRM